MTIDATKIFKQRLTSNIANLIAQFEAETQTKVAGIYVRAGDYCTSHPKVSRIDITVEVPDLVEAA